MNAANNMTNRQRVEAKFSAMHSKAKNVSQLSETLWLCITFLLFIAMGPFSVIAVVYGLWSLASAENREKMIEPQVMSS